MSVCELLLSGNKSRVIGVAGPPEGKARVMKEGGRKGQNERKGGGAGGCEMKFSSQQLSPQRPCHV